MGERCPAVAMTATTHYLSLKLLVPTHTHTHTHTSPPPSGAARHGNPVPADGESVWCGAGAVIRLAKNILVKNICSDFEGESWQLLARVAGRSVETERWTRIFSPELSWCAQCAAEP